MTKKDDKEKPDTFGELRDGVVKIAEIMHARNFSSGTGSNYSVRVADDEMLITPTGINKAWLKPEQLIHVKFNGKVISGGGEVSTEFPMHVWIYKALSVAKAIIHSNPPYLTAFAVAGQGLDTAHLTEPYLQVGDYIPLVHYATPSTEDLASMFKPYLMPNRKVYLMQNHGVVAVGSDIVDTYNRMSMAENYAHIMSMFGLPGPKIIDKMDLKLLNETFK